MSNVLKISGPIKVGTLSADPSNPQEGYIYFNSTSGNFRMYENGSFRDISAEQLEAHFDGTASKHDATEIDYERTDGSKLNIQAASDDVESALTDLDDAIGTLNQGTNYTASDATAVGSHLDAIDDALATAGGSEFADDVFRVTGSVDATKKVAIEADGLTTATTRTITMPDSNVDLGDIASNSAHAAGDGSDHQDVADLATLSGVAANSTTLGTFTGTTIADAETIKGALQDLEDGVETKAASSTVTEIDANVNDLITLSGVAENTTTLGTFTGTTITDNSTVKTALQELETSVETKAADADVIKKDGSVAFTADQSMGGNKLTNLATPTADSDAATKSYVDAVKQGLDVKDSVRAASTANVNLGVAGDGTLDGVALSNGDRVLLKDQTTGSQNGIYDAVTAADRTTWTRSADADADSEVTAGMFTFVAEGSTNADSGWVLTTDDPITVGTTALSFAQFSGAGQIVAGDALSKSGNTLNVNVDGQGIEVLSDQLALELDGTTLSKSASGLKVNEITNTEVSATAAIDTTKLADGSVSNTEFQHLDGVTSNIQTQLNTKLENVVEDTTPQLGGNLDTNGNAVLHDTDGLKRGNTATPTNLVEEEYIDAISLLASQTGAVISELTFAHATFEGLEVAYKVKEATSNDVRIGTLRVVTNGTNVVLNDVSTETADTGITFSAAINGANVEIRYDSGTNGATMRADAKRIRA